jgi:hypothetical protein
MVLSIGAVLGLLLAGAGAGSGGVGTSAVAEAHSARATTVRVLLLEKAPFAGDAAKPRPGGLLLFQEDAVTAAGRRIGDSVTRIQVFQKGAYLLDCVVRLAAGNLLFSGAEQFEHTAKSVFAVTGGTGRYSGVDGHVTATPATVKGAAATLLTFRLDR